MIQSLSSWQQMTVCIKHNIMSRREHEHFIILWEKKEHLSFYLTSMFLPECLQPVAALPVGF